MGVFSGTPHLTIFGAFKYAKYAFLVHIWPLQIVMAYRSIMRKIFVCHFLTMLHPNFTWGEGEIKKKLFLGLPDYYLCLYLALQPGERHSMVREKIVSEVAAGQPLFFFTFFYWFLINRWNNSRATLVCFSIFFCLPITILVYSHHT